jgi:hypothetical protein
MNLAVIKWLIANRDVLTECLSIVSSYDHDSSLLERWEVVNRLARVIIPALEGEDIETLAYGEPSILSDDSYSAMSCGAELSAMGVDWHSLVSTLIPIVIAIIKSLIPSEDE